MWDGEVTGGEGYNRCPHTITHKCAETHILCKTRIRGFTHECGEAMRAPPPHLLSTTHMQTHKLTRSRLNTRKKTCKYSAVSVSHTHSHSVSRAPGFAPRGTIWTPFCQWLQCKPCCGIKTWRFLFFFCVCIFFVLAFAMKIIICGNLKYVMFCCHEIQRSPDCLLCILSAVSKLSANYTSK